MISKIDWLNEKFIKSKWVKIIIIQFDKKKWVFPRSHNKPDKHWRETASSIDFMKTWNYTNAINQELMHVSSLF